MSSVSPVTWQDAAERVRAENARAEQDMAVLLSLAVPVEDSPAPTRLPRAETAAPGLARRVPDHQSVIVAAVLLAAVLFVSLAGATLLGAWKARRRRRCA